MHDKFLVSGRDEKLKNITISTSLTIVVSLKHRFSDKDLKSEVNKNE